MGHKEDPREAEFLESVERLGEYLGYAADIARSLQNNPIMKDLFGGRSENLHQIISNTQININIYETYFKDSCYLKIAAKRGNMKEYKQIKKSSKFLSF